MTSDQVEAEVARVSALVREYMEDTEKFAEEHNYTDIQYRTWQIGCIVIMNDEDGDIHEIVTAMFESSSRVVQTGMSVWLLANALDSGNVEDRD